MRKVNSFSDAKVFYDFETARSSGLSHVLSHRVSNPSPRGLIGRTFCLQLASRNSFGTSGHVVEDLFAPGEPSAAIFGNSRNVASASCGRVFFRKMLREQMDWIEPSESCNFQTEICKDSFNLESSFSSRRSLSDQTACLSYRGIKSQNCISIKCLIFQPFCVGRRVSKPKNVLVPVVSRMLCCGSKKQRCQVGGRSCDVAIDERA